MIPYEIDPSLHLAERELQLLDGGFSAPPSQQADTNAAEWAAPVQRLADALASKSDF